MKAIWFGKADMKSWTRAVGFSNAVDDTAHWRFRQIDEQKWQAKRWLPKEARNKDYYLSEYRFTQNDYVDVYSYTFRDTSLFRLDKKEGVILEGALQGISSIAFALLAVPFLLSF